MSKTEQLPSWIDLPEDVTANILHRLGAVEILESAQRVCTTWLNVCKDPLMWRVIDMKNKGPDEERPDRLYSAFLRAVELSQGQLTDVRLEYYGLYGWLPNLAERPTQLRRLTLASCPGRYSDKYLNGIIMKFPLLEELHIFYMRTYVSARKIESIGRSCSKLKAFTFDHKGFSEPTIVSDSLALAVANSMPGLLHLRLVGNKLSNTGLKAILDGCPHLESLDIRKCFNVVLEGDLGNRCSQQIKSLKRPLDSTGNERVPGFDLEENGYNLNDSEHKENNSPFYGSDTDSYTPPVRSFCGGRCNICNGDDYEVDDDYSDGDSNDYDSVSDEEDLEEYLGVSAKYFDLCL